MKTRECEAGRPYEGSDFQVGEACPEPGEFQLMVDGKRTGGVVCAGHTSVSATSYSKSISVEVVRAAEEKK